MNKSSEKRLQDIDPTQGSDALKLLTPAEFAALGAGDVVFWRTTTAGEIVEFIPQAAAAPHDMMLQLLMSADGAPVLLSDNDEAVHDWIDSHHVHLATLH